MLGAAQSRRAWGVCNPLACAMEGTCLMIKVGAGLPKSANLAAAVISVLVHHGLNVCRALPGGETGPPQSPPPAFLFVIVS